MYLESLPLQLEAKNQESLPLRLEVSNFRVPVIATGGQLKYPESLAMPLEVCKVSRVSVISTKDQGQYQGSQSLPLEVSKSIKNPFSASKGQS